MKTCKTRDDMPFEVGMEVFDPDTLGFDSMFVGQYGFDRLSMNGHTLCIVDKDGHYKGMAHPSRFFADKKNAIKHRITALGKNVQEYLNIVESIKAEIEKLTLSL